MLGELKFNSKTRTQGACAPWNSADALATVKVKMTVTPQKLIDKCLECREPKCWNCLVYKREIK